MSLKFCQSGQGSVGTAQLCSTWHQPGGLTRLRSSISEMALVLAVGWLGTQLGSWVGSLVLSHTASAHGWAGLLGVWPSRVSQSLTERLASPRAQETLPGLSEAQQPQSVTLIRPLFKGAAGPAQIPQEGNAASRLQRGREITLPESRRGWRWFRCRLLKRNPAAGELGLIMCSSHRSVSQLREQHRHIQLSEDTETHAPAVPSCC